MTTVAVAFAIALLFTPWVLRRVPWKWPCAVGLHRWSTSSPWREHWAGGYWVRACDRCGPPGGWREFWTPLPYNTRGKPLVRDYQKGGMIA